MPPRVTDTDAARWKGMYDAGQTIESIALDEQRAPETIRNHLHRLGTVMRSASSGKRTSNNGFDGVRGKRTPGITRVTVRAKYRGHRRRGA